MADEIPKPGVAIPVVEETAHLSKREVATGQVAVSLTTDQVQRTLRETLRNRRVEVERVAVGRVLEPGEAPPSPREEGNLLIIPVVEETAVVVKRLVVREEVRLRFLTEDRPFAEDVTLRRQKAAVTRSTVSSPRPEPDPAKG